MRLDEFLSERLAEEMAWLDALAYAEIGAKQYGPPDYMLPNLQLSIAAQQVAVRDFRTYRLRVERETVKAADAEAILPALERVLRLFARRFCEHADYQSEWAPANRPLA